MLTLGILLPATAQYHPAVHYRLHAPALASLLALPAPSTQGAVFDACDAVAANNLALRQPIQPVMHVMLQQGNTPLRIAGAIHCQRLMSPAALS